MTEQSQTSIQRVHATVLGLVQGVNFRAYTAREASRLGLSGWVRNRPDGSVETVAEGPRGALDVFVDFLHRGSPSADVTDVSASWSDATGEFDSFKVRYI